MPKETDNIPFTDSFSHWLEQTRRNLASGGSADVPCGGCTGCCRAKQFVHIEADETETLSRIPGRYLFPAPGKPAGTMVMGYDDEGRCPMLAGNGCSIYAHRPRTCRQYDCRVLAAAGVEVEDEDRRPIAEQVARWQIECDSSEDRANLDALRSAAGFLHGHPECFESGKPANETELALHAVKAQPVFVGPAHDVPGSIRGAEDDVVENVRRTVRDFDSRDE